MAFCRSIVIVAVPADLVDIGESRDGEERKGLHHK
jgi:hypothetical protein